MTTPEGAQRQRTGLAWRRTALASAGCAVLLLHSAATHHWGRALIPVVLAAATSLVLAVTAVYRERILASPGPWRAHAAPPAIASLFVTATALSLILLR